MTRLKLDENVDVRWAKVLVDQGHDTTTTAGQGMRGAQDETVFQVCKAEGRALVTPDPDFSNILR